MGLPVSTKRQEMIIEVCIYFVAIVKRKFVRRFESKEERPMMMDVYPFSEHSDDMIIHALPSEAKFFRNITMILMFTFSPYNSTVINRRTMKNMFLLLALPSTNHRESNEISVLLKTK